MARKPTTVERELARIASRAHGVVTRAQLIDAGISSDEIHHRLQTGALIRVHRGVYRVGHQAPGLEAHYLAAVLACGQGALLSGRAAAYLLGLVRGSAPPPEVTTLVKRRVPGIEIRRTRRDTEGIVYRGIPVTSIPRTLVDLAAVLSERDLARACHEAGVKYRTTPRMVDAALADRPRTRGASTLRRILHGDVRVVLSRLEGRFLDRVREIERPLPVTNRHAGSKRVDCRWPEHHLTVELDSYRFHSSRHAWQQDRRREREAYARGDQFRRYTWEDVFERPVSMLCELRMLLPAT